MPRKASIDAPGALHHIVIRGIERKPIFKDSLDYQNFIEGFKIRAKGIRLSQLIETVAAWLEVDV